jgi:uncharacterized membrane protein
MTQIQNERTKLTANWLNALASGVIVTGVVAPSVALLFQLANGIVPHIWVILLASMIWLSMGYALHSVARLILGRLE